MKSFKNWLRARQVFVVDCLGLEYAVFSTTIFIPSANPLNRTLCR